MDKSFDGIYRQLQSIKENSQSFMASEYFDPVWADDVTAIEIIQAFIILKQDEFNKFLESL